MFATPRRLAVHITQVADKAANQHVTQKLMPVSVGLDAQGQATPALLKKLQSMGLGAEVVGQLHTKADGKAETLFVDQQVEGQTLAHALQAALLQTLGKLPIAKTMTYQLMADTAMPGWDSVSFVRPAHGLVALHGDQVVPISVLGLHADQATQGHRFEAKVSPVVIKHADAYADTLLQDGAVIASFEARRDSIAQQLQAAAHGIGSGVAAIHDPELLDEVTALVERPNVLVCQFDPAFLEVPQECLILTMKANQKYFPLLDASGKLTHRFLVVSNISPADPSAVIGGNERVVRPRLADAQFFFNQDRKKTLASRVEGLGKVVYHNKLGTQGERTERVRLLANRITDLLPQAKDAAFRAAVDTAARLAKTDLLTDMVGEFPELQGTMGAYYARHDGLGEEIAQAIEDHYKPRFAGDELPRNPVGLVVALADKLETLVGMFGIGNLPTGDKDPFALRRHALGVVRMLSDGDVDLHLDDLLAQCEAVFGDKIEPVAQVLTAFIHDRMAVSLRDQSYSAQEVDAVLALNPQRLGDVRQRLLAVRAFAALPESAALAAANKRIGNVLKKAGDVAPHVNPALFKEAAETQLHQTMQQLLPTSLAQFEAGDYTASLQTLAALRQPVDAYFDGVMVNAEDPALRLNRQGLLKSLHVAMNRVADLSRLSA
jgi:glycyl-tRNA synthetase beta chain